MQRYFAKLFCMRPELILCLESLFYAQRYSLLRYFRLALLWDSVMTDVRIDENFFLGGPQNFR